MRKYKGTSGFNNLKGLLQGNIKKGLKTGIFKGTYI